MEKKTTTVVYNTRFLHSNGRVHITQYPHSLHAIVVVKLANIAIQ